jgi:hypothetical protein
MLDGVTEKVMHAASCFVLLARQKQCLGERAHHQALDRTMEEWGPYAQ